MEHRPYFLLGDLAASTVTGAVAALATTAVVSPDGNMLLGMLVGMVLGMFLALVLGFTVFFPLFGAMEVMLPSMLTGMVAGMAAGMMPPESLTGAAAAGASIGLVVLVLTYLANIWIRPQGDQEAIEE
jgi:hypothetical protein